MVPQIFFRVCHYDECPPAETRSKYVFTPALLRNFSRRKVKGCDFPAIIPQPGHTVLGAFVTGLSYSNVQALNMYEGSMYTLDDCSVQILPHDAVEEDGRANQGVVASAEKEFQEGKAQVVKSRVYVWADPVSDLGEEEWHYADFRRDNMAKWIFSNDEEYAEAAQVQKKVHETIDLTGAEDNGVEEEYEWSGRKMTREEFEKLHEKFRTDGVGEVEREVNGQTPVGLRGGGKEDGVEESETEEMRTKRIASVIAGIAREEELAAEVD